MATNTARRHHYLTAAYLAGFTAGGKRGSQFFVVEPEGGRAFKTSPNNVGVQRDFNRVDIDGVSPDVIERALAPFEQQAVSAIDDVLKTETFPVFDSYQLILNLLCLFAVRNPHFRGSFNQARERVVGTVAELLVSDRKIWEQHVGRLENGSEMSAMVSFEQMKKFVQDKQYQVEFATDGNLAAEFEIFDQLLPLLGARDWSLFVAPEGGPELICSDHPVILRWKDGHQGPIGFALRHTEVFFPLGRRAGLYGVFEDPQPQVVTMQPRHVAAMNDLSIRNAQRHIYSAQRSFQVLHEGEVVSLTCTTS